MIDAVLGLGTNLGDRLASLRHGVRALRAVPGLSVLARSPIYESDALTPPEAPADWHRPYLNMAVRARFAGGVDELLAATKAIETRLGRTARARWAPRELDIDILAIGDLVRSDERLTLPHAGIADRPFALFPLRDLTPEWRFPTGEWAGRTAREVAARWPAGSDRIPLRTRRTALHLTELVGILNLTPDSFSDGGTLTDPGRAVSHAIALVEQGATVLDLGAESTRPGAVPVTAREEWDRLAESLRRVISWRSSARARVEISVDTRRAEVARRAIDAGADWINDVTGFSDPAMIEAVAGSSVRLVVMHSLSIPPRRDLTLDPETDPVASLNGWAGARIAALESAGIGQERLVLDPGFGFGKTPEQAAEICRRAGELRHPGVDLLIGHSRKSFLQAWFDGAVELAVAAGRDPETAALSVIFAAHGADYLRVHDVQATHRALRVSALAGPTARI